MATKAENKTGNIADTATKTIDTATKTIEDVANKSQERLLSAIEQGQAAMADGYEAVVAAANKIELPSIPGVESVTPNLEALKIPRTAVDSYFDFAERVLAGQREFVERVFAAPTVDIAEGAPAKAAKATTAKATKATKSTATKAAKATKSAAKA